MDWVCKYNYVNKVLTKTNGVFTTADKLYENEMTHLPDAGASYIHNAVMLF